ncbi:ABC transporter ATP-binding protein [Dactylosporangium sp. CA-052675]|uniref:ABC transporter ATP-binding protein n=1 Tax=Dactylosporangium sp. CA-052675 TaxID=3239927 RepID=UPI003D903BBD
MNNGSWADPGPQAGGLGARAGAAVALVWRAGKGALLGSAALALLAGAWPVAGAWLTKLVIDRIGRPGPALGTLVALAAGLAVVGVLSATVPHLQRYLDAQLRRRIDLLARAELFAAVNRFVGLRRFEQPRFHDRLRMAEQAGQAAASQIVQPGIDAARMVVTVGGFVATLSVLSPVMTAVVLLAAAPAVAAEVLLGRARAAMAWRMSPRARRQLFYADLLTDLRAAKEVRLFGLGGFLRGRLLREVGAANDGEQALDRREVLVQAGLSALGGIAAGAGLVWVVADAAGGRLSVGDIAVFVAAVAGVQGGLIGLVGQLGGAYEALLHFGHYRAVLRAGPDLPVAPAAPPVPALREGVELRDVWFRYDDAHPWVLRGVDLFLPRGRAVALVGLNGSGKSTLVKLLCRFYDPQRGAVLWDGADIRGFDPASLRRRLAAVFQDSVAFDLTAAENVGLGDLGALEDRDRLRAAATLAGIDGTLSGLPRGYDTMLSRTFFDAADGDDPEAGVLLSGGQWQRVALARAYLRDDRDLAILDEPSAGLDAEAEHDLHRDLHRHRAGRTNLLISHRLSAVRTADLIVVLAEGRIVEQGTHAALMAAGGAYARLFELQAAGYSDDLVSAPADVPG